MASVLLILSKQLGGRRKVLLTLARAARPEGKGMMDKKGETFGFPLLARSAVAQAANMQFGISGLQICVSDACARKSTAEPAAPTRQAAQAYHEKGTAGRLCLFILRPR